jgi:hypothetical protein
LKSSSPKRNKWLRASSKKITWITKRAKVSPLCDLATEFNSTQLAEPAVLPELKQWLRLNPIAAMQTGDGLDDLASGSPAVPDWIAP